MTTLLSMLNKLADRRSTDHEQRTIEIVKVVAAMMLAHRQQEREEFKTLQRRLGHAVVDRKAVEKTLTGLGLTYEQVDVAFRDFERDDFDATPVVLGDPEPEFTVPDNDLNNLLNLTALLLGGNANMDVGIAWSDALDAVEKRLTTAKGQPC